MTPYKADLYDRALRLRIDSRSTDVFVTAEALARTSRSDPTTGFAYGSGPFFPAAGLKITMFTMFMPPNASDNPIKPIGNLQSPK